MNADSATCLQSSVLEPAHCRRPDLVPSRVAYHHPLTEYEKQQAELAAEQEAGRSPRSRFTLPPVPETQTTTELSTTGSQGLLSRAHPSDVMYWVACLGGAGLLLLSATR
jgi:hypothetical protein